MVTPAPVPIVAVGGTHSFRGCERVEELRGQWWYPGSAWWRELEAGGCVPLRPADPFVWSSDIDGGFRFPWVKFRAPDWEAGAHALAWYLRDVPLERRRVVAHSHGGNLAAVACAHGLELAALVTVGTPVRREFEDRATYRAAASRIGRWLHIHSDRSDRWQAVGEWFDGRIGPVRQFTLAGVLNHRINGIGHSSILNDPARIELWRSQGWISFLRGD